MNTVRHPKNFLWLLLATSLALGPAMRAAAEAPEAKPDKPAAPAAAPAEAPKPAAVAPATPAGPETPTAAATESATPAAPAAELRELGAEPAAEEAKAEASDDSKDETAPAEAPGEPTGPAKHKHGSHHGPNSNDRVSFASNGTLAAGEHANSVVSIGGSSTSAGEVDDAVVSILGGSRVTGGTVGDAVVSVLGNTFVNGHVRGDVVSVGGNIELGPDAVVDGEIVCIGGLFTRDAKAVVKGDIQNIAVAGHHLNFDGVTVWFSECLLYARPLAFHGQLLWAWCIALGLLVLYSLIALVAPAGVVKCTETLEQRPGYSLLAALLTLLLTPVAYILLVLTLFIAVGFVLIPLFSLGLFFSAIFGKVVMLAWLGRRFTKLAGGGPLAHPVFGVLIGGLIILGLYTIPVVGFIVYKLLGILGLGVVVYTLILQYKASRPPKPVGAVAVPLAAPVAADAGGIVPPLLAAPVALPVISSATLARAGFWLRLAAAGLDAVMVAIVLSLLHRIWSGFNGIFPFWYAVYCIVFWATKGTTIGGIICGLKLVRLDDRPLDWSVAIVRALGGFLSLAVVGLGFVWVAFDAERQSWHDKIAGTTIVRVPKGTPLL